MIPFFLLLSVRWDSGRSFRLWLPLFLLWILLLPFAILLLPFVLLYCLIGWVNPFRSVAIVWGIFSALRGTDIAIEQPNQMIHLKII